MGNDGFSKCHPLTNFLFFLGAICFGVLFQHPAYLGCALVCSGLYYMLLHGRKGFKSIGLMLPLLIVIALINPLFNTRGEHILFSILGRPYTLEALGYGLAVGTTLLITLLWFGCYQQIITTDKFISLFGNLAPSLSLLLVMVLRLIPGLQSKAKQIADARRCIGKGAENGSVKEKTSHGMTVLLTLSGWALEGGIVTADSMKSRGYGTAKRSCFHTYRIKRSDGLLLTVMAIIAGLTIYGAATGSVYAVYTPRFFAAPVSVFLPIYCTFLLIPVGIHLKEALLCRIFISKI